MIVHLIVGFIYLFDLETDMKDKIILELMNNQNKIMQKILELLESKQPKKETQTRLKTHRHLSKMEEEDRIRSLFRIIKKKQGGLKTWQLFDLFWFEHGEDVISEASLFRDLKVMVARKMIYKDPVFDTWYVNDYELIKNRETS